MSSDNLSVILYGKNDIRLEERPLPVPEKHEVLIKVAYVTICGTDIHFVKAGSSCGVDINFPMVLGHEGSGTVVQCGEEVTTLKIGDRVTMECGPSCQQCEHCKKGRYNLCPSGEHLNGFLCRYVQHRADFCHKLPDNISVLEGALFEPYSVTVYACLRGQVRVGKKVLICGAGSIGLMTLITAKAMGASSIVITDISEDFLETARSLGADHTLNVSSLQPGEIRKKIIELLGEEPDITLECTGVESCIQAGVLTTKSGGKYVQVGHSSSEYQNMPIMNAAFREVDILGLFRYPNCYPIAMDMVASGKINIKPLITDMFPLEEADKAIQRKLTGGGAVVKVAIKCNE